MTPVTVTMEQLVAWGMTGYTFLHVMFGMVTHYHSVYQVRSHNKRVTSYSSGYKRIGAPKMCLFFLGRMVLGFPWFVGSRLIAPIGRKWHMDAAEIAKWGSGFA